MGSGLYRVSFWVPKKTCFFFGSEKKQSPQSPKKLQWSPPLKITSALLLLPRKSWKGLGSWQHQGLYSFGTNAQALPSTAWLIFGTCDFEGGLLLKKTPCSSSQEGHLLGCSSGEWLVQGFFESPKKLFFSFWLWKKKQSPQSPKKNPLEPPLKITSALLLLPRKSWKGLGSWQHLGLYSFGTNAQALSSTAWLRIKRRIENEIKEHGWSVGCSIPNT